MNKNLIGKINGVEIVTVEQDGEVYVPIKPICTALGVHDNGQRTKIYQDVILASVGNVILSTGADGKQYEMFCLPIKYIYGWLFTIQPERVAPDAREIVIKYQRECYDVLYDHFSGGLRRQVEANEAEIELLKRLNEVISIEKDAKLRRKKVEEDLAKLRAERLNPQPKLFD